MALAGAPTVLLLLSMVSAVASRSTWIAQEIFDTDNCTSTPVVVSLTESTRCSPRQCVSVEINNATKSMNSECNITNRFTYAGQVFGEYNYIVVEDYGSAGCENLRLTTVLPASGSCSESTVYGRHSIVSALFANGSALIALYPDAHCEGDVDMNFVFDSGNISSGDCVQNYYKFYTSASEVIEEFGSEAVDADTGSSSGDQESSSSPSFIAILGIVLAAGAVGFMTAVFFWKRRTPHDEQSTDESEDIVDSVNFVVVFKNLSRVTSFRSALKSSQKEDRFSLISSAGIESTPRSEVMVIKESISRSPGVRLPVVSVLPVLMLRLLMIGVRAKRLPQPTEIFGHDGEAVSSICLPIARIRKEGVVRTPNFGAASSLNVHSSITVFQAQELYSGSHCTGTPNVLKMIETDTCDPQTCTPHDLGGYTLFVAASCNVTDRFKYTHERFQGFDYVMMEEYGGVGCANLVQTTVYPASGTCEKSSALANSSDIVSLFSNGTAVVLLFDDGDCGGKPSLQFDLDRESITNGECIQDHYRFYTGVASGRTDSSSSAYSYERGQQLGGWSFDSSSDGLSWGAITAIVAGSVACVAFLAFATFKYVRRRYDDNLSKDTGIAALAASYAGYPTPESALNAITLGSEASYSQGNTEEGEKPRSRRNLSGISGLWDDE
ncbi:hypothetical protein JG688_00000573, partial [Phytophthora aleatoria]